jgi:hypothetical protein
MGLDTLWLSSAICKAIDSLHFFGNKDKNLCILGLTKSLVVFVLYLLNPLAMELNPCCDIWETGSETRAAY